MDQALEPCRKLFSRLLEEIGSHPSALSDRLQRAVTPRDLALVAEIALLAASLARADGNFSESKRLVTLVEAHLTSRGFPAGFHLYFQKGLNLLLGGNYSEALEMFLLAKANARSRRERVYSVSNTLYCLENLGLSFDPVLRELKALLDGVPADRLRDSRALLEALELRLAFEVEE